MSTPTQDAVVIVDPKAAPTTVVVALVLDETGSMAPTVTDTIGAVNDYFETLAKESPEALVSIHEFSDCFGQEPTFRPLCSGVKATDVPKLDATNYRPRGNTPLYDAIGKAIRDTEALKADANLLVVMTDGQENASHEWDLIGIRKLIEQKQGDGWVIVYLGANQDAWQVGTNMGVHGGNTMSFQTGVTGKGTRASMGSLAGATSSYVAGATGPPGPEGPKGKTETFFEDAGQTEADYKDPDEK